MLASEMIYDLRQQLADDLETLQAVRETVLQALEMLDKQIERLEKTLE